MLTSLISRISGAGAGGAGAGPSSPRPVPEVKESVKVTSCKFYQQDGKENYLSYYLALLKSSDLHAQQALVAKIVNQLRNPQFKMDMGMVASKKCPCFKKDEDQKCKTIDQNDIVNLIRKYCLPEEKEREWTTGLCQSCGIELTMWDERRQVQRISSFNICAFDVNTCINKETIPNLRIYCRGCSVFAELCYYDWSTMNYYRGMVFHMKGDQSPGYYFPNIDVIDEKHRSVAISANRDIGDRAAISRQWRAQEGFVTYSLPKRLELELLKDGDRKVKIKAANNPNIDAYTSAYYEEGDPDIKKIKSVLPTKEFGVDGGLVQGRAPAKKRKLGESKMAKARAEAKAKAIAEASVATKLCSMDDKFVVFKIPIDPRKSMKKRSLSALTLTTMDRNQPLEEGNCLLTTRLLAGLEERFDYEEFLRWGLDCFRVVTPLFLPQKATMHCELKWTEEDKKKIEEISKISASVKKKADDIKKLNAEIKNFENSKNEYVKDLRSKIISLVDSNEDLELLSKHNLVPTMSERKQARTNLKPDLVLNQLPHLLSAHGLLVDGIDPSTLSEKCKMITDNLFDSAKAPPKKSTFSLKYFNKVEEKEKKEEKKKKSASHRK